MAPRDESAGTRVRTNAWSADMFTNPYPLAIYARACAIWWRADCTRARSGLWKAAAEVMDMRVMGCSCQGWVGLSDPCAARSWAWAVVSAAVRR